MTHINPIGVVRLSIQSAHIIPWSKLRGGSPDPFVGVSINDGEELVRTRHQSHDFEPTWMETKYIVVYSLNDILKFRLYDHHEHRRHVLLGDGHLALSKVKNELESHHLSLVKDEKQRGELLVSVAYHPTADNRETSEISSGIATLAVLAARRLDAGSFGDGTFNPMAQISLGASGILLCKTQRGVNTVDPVWDLWHNFYWPSKSTCTISVKVLEEGNSAVGELLLSLDDLIEGNSAGVEWWPLSGCQSGEVHIRAEWRAVDLMV